MSVRVCLLFIVFIAFLSKANAGENIEIGNSLDVSRLKGSPVRYYSFDFDNPAKLQVPLPSLVFRGEKNMIEKCRPIILDRVIYPILLKSTYAVAAFDFRIAPGTLEHRIYWIPGGIHEGRSVLKDCNEIQQSDYLGFMGCQGADCN